MLPHQHGLSESLSRLTLGKRGWSAASATGAPNSAADTAAAAASASEGDGDAAKRSRVAGFDEYMKAHALGDAAHEWALSLFDKTNATRKSGPTGAASDVRGADTSLLRNILGEEMNPHHWSPSMCDAREAELLRQSYVAPEQNAMQMIVHPEATTTAHGSDALLRNMRAGFLLERRRRRRVRQRDGDMEMDAGACDDGVVNRGVSSSLHQDDEHHDRMVAD